MKWIHRLQNALVTAGSIWVVQIRRWLESDMTLLAEYQPAALVSCSLIPESSRLLRMAMPNNGPREVTDMRLRLLGHPSFYVDMYWGCACIARPSYRIPCIFFCIYTNTCWCTSAKILQLGCWWAQLERGTSHDLHYTFGRIIKNTARHALLDGRFVFHLNIREFSRVNISSSWNNEIGGSYAPSKFRIYCTFFFVCLE